MGLAALLPVPARAQAPAAPVAPVARIAVPPEFPLESFFRNPERAYYRISTDGQHISFMQPAVGEGGPVPRRNVFVQRFDGRQLVGTPRQVTRESARDIPDYFWKSGATLIYTQDAGGDENFRVVAVEAASGKVTTLTPAEGVRAFVTDPLRDDPEHVLVSHNARDKRVNDVYRVHVKTGRAERVVQNPGNVTGWTTDHRGRVRLGLVTDGVNRELLWRADEASPWKPIIRTDFRTSVQPHFFDTAGKRFYASSNRGRDKSAIVLIDPAQPDREELVWAHPEVDVEGLAMSQRRKVPTFAAYEVDKPGRHFFDAQAQAMFAALARQLPGRELTIQAETHDERRFIVAAYSDRTQGERYVYDRPANRLVKLGQLAPWLPEVAMAPMQPIRYAARDGLPIRGYLTLPVGREPKDLPCVINPHGGPWARDSWGWNPEVQFLANRGFCVLQMNFRGSTGFGRAFWEKSFGQWGLAMQDDVTDGVKWLVAQGIADPKRIAIYGASYGGYAALSGIVKEPELFAAAVSYVGVSNLLTFMNTIPPYWEPFRRQMHEMVGNAENPADLARMRATSPALNAERIRTPLLVAQGARDPRVIQAESDQIVEALRRRGVAVEYIVKENEGHGFANEENQFEYYGAMEKFLKKHTAGARRD